MSVETGGPAHVRDPPSTRSRLLVTFAVVVAVLVILSTVSYFVLRPPEGLPDGGGGGFHEPYPWQLPTDAQAVAADTTWTGRTGVLNSPVRVGGNATLRLVDCDLTVMLEDLVFWQRPAFDVAGGGALVLEDSTITIYMDPRFERSVLFSYWPPQNRVAYIARPVNLSGALDPVLHLDVSWWGGGTPVAVGVLPTFGARVTVLRTVDPGEPRHHEWRAVDVPLRAYAGTVPWVVVFASAPQRDMAFLGNASVIDGSAPLLGDSFPTGNPLKDGWTTGYCQDPGYVMRAYRHGSTYAHGTDGLWQGLIRSEGDVSISGSRLIAPAGLTRHANFETVLEETDSRRSTDICLAGSQGGHVAVNGSVLTITGSRLENVPLVVNGTSVDIRDTTVVGDADMFSMRSPSGIIQATSFEALPANPHYESYGHQSGRYLWPLGVQGTSQRGPLTVTGCQFRGGDLAVQLSRAHVDLRGCTFQDMADYVIWDHGSTGLGDWATISATNGFVRCSGTLLLRTVPVELETFSPDASATELGPPTDAWVRSDLGVYNNVHYHSSTFIGNRTRLMVPVVMVHSDWMVVVTKAPTVELSWDDKELDIPIELDVPLMRVDITRILEAEWWVDVRAPMTLSAIAPADGGGPGCYTAHIGVDLRHLFAFNVTLEVLLDGALCQWIDFNDDRWSRYYDEDWLEVEQNVTLGTGWHWLNASIAGLAPVDRYNFSDVPSAIDTKSFSLLTVLDGTWVDGTLEPFEAVSVLLGPGAGLSMRPGTPEGTVADLLDLRVVGGNGSWVGLDGSDAGELGAVEIVLEGSVSCTVANVTAGVMYVTDSFALDDLDSVEGTVTIDNTSADALYLSVVARDVSVTDCSVSGHFRIDSNYYNNVTIERSTFTGGTSSVDLHFARLEMRGCTFSTGSEMGMMVFTYEACAVDVRDCTFDASALLVLLSGLYLDDTQGVVVDGCTFEGEGAFLYVGVDLTDVTNYDGMPWTVPAVAGRIANNTFDGPGTGAVLHHGLYGALFKGNVVHDGARLYAQYITILMVIHGDSRPPRPDSWAIIERGGVTADYPFTLARDFGADGEALVDVTDATGAESSPPRVPIIFGSPAYERLLVMGFTTIDLLANNGEVTYTMVTNWDNLLEPLVSDR